MGVEETIYGYVRVSTQEQNEVRQLAAMREFGIPEENIVVEKLSGKDFNRFRYRRLVQGLRPGDVLVVKSIDRLGRNYTEILDQWSLITKKREAAIVVLDMPLLDTRQSRDLTGTLISDIVLQLLSYVAQTERENIRQRQDLPLPVFVPIPDGLPPQKAAGGGGMIWISCKVKNLSTGSAGELSGDVVVPVAHSGAIGALVVQQGGLGVDVLRHIRVDVQVVRGQIGQHGDPGAPAHGQKLERA